MPTAAPATGGAYWNWWPAMALTALTLAVAGDLYFSPPARDCWLYRGFYVDLREHLARWGGSYYASRLGVILPGALSRFLLPAVPANLLLHLSLGIVALASFASVAERQTGRAVALAATALFGTDPQFVRAVGWDYVDGFGIAYFLLAIAAVGLAQRSGRRTWLLAAGAALAGAISCSLFYAVFGLPVAWEVVAAARERRARPAAIAQELGLLAAGGALLLLTLAAINAVLGGDPFVFTGSLLFVRQSTETTDPFRHPSGQWLPTAFWLATPALAAAGAVAVLLTRGHEPRVRRAQAQHLVLCAIFAGLQFGANFHSLEYLYYASLLLPTAFLAFAGQMRALGVAVPYWALAVAALAVAGLVATTLLPFPTLDLRWASVLVKASLVLGPLWPLALLTRRAAAAYILPPLVALTFSMWLPSSGPPGPAMRQLEQMDRVVAYLKRNASAGPPRLWYRESEPGSGRVADAIAAAYLLCPSMIGLSFPDLPEPLTCDRQPITSGMQIAVLTSRSDWWEAAEASLARLGKRAERGGETLFPGETPLRVGLLTVRE